MNPAIKSQEIMSAFQRYLSSGDASEIEKYTLRELRATDEQWGQRDVEAGFRIALRNRILVLEGVEDRKGASNIRAVQMIATLVIGIITVVAATYITNALSLGVD